MGMERGKKVGGGAEPGKFPPPHEQHAAAERNHHHDGNCGMLRAFCWVKINAVQLREFLEPKKFKRFEGEDGRKGKTNERGGGETGDSRRSGGRER